MARPEGDVNGGPRPRRSGRAGRTGGLRGQVEPTLDQHAPVRAYDRNAPTRGFSTRLAVPVYWRCTSAEHFPLLRKPGLRYAHRMTTEQRLAEIIQAFHADALSSAGSSR